MTMLCISTVLGWVPPGVYKEAWIETGTPVELYRSTSSVQVRFT
jgi:hypothetical protein